MLPKYHSKQGHEVTVIASLVTYNEKGEPDLLEGPAEYKDSNGYTVIRLGYKKPCFWNRRFRHYQGFESKLGEISPDIIFIHGLSFGDTPIIRKYKQINPHVKVFADNHTDYINSASNWLSKWILHKIVWRHYSKVIEPYLIKCYGVTPMRCTFLKDVYRINPSIIDFLPMGVDDDLIPKNRVEEKMKVREELGIKDDDFVIFTGGKIGRLKNIHVLIDALRFINNQSIHLIICGVLTPEMEYMHSFINENKNIHHLGWCNDLRVIQCMNASDIACFPGTHSTLWEQSVGMGLPSVFKKWPEMEHVNINGNCLFVKGEDVHELANVIEYLLNKEELKKINKLAQEASKQFLYSEISKRAIQEF